MHVYVIERPDGLVKIGKSGNPTKRIHALENQGGFRSERAWMSLPGAMDTKTELRAHHALSHNRTVGEWFSIDFDHAVSAVLANSYTSPMPMDTKSPRKDDTKTRFADRLSQALTMAGVPDKSIDKKRHLSAIASVTERHAGTLRMGLTIPASRAAARMLLNSPLATRAAIAGWSRFNFAAKRFLSVPPLLGRILSDLFSLPLPTSPRFGASSGALAIVALTFSIAVSDCSSRAAACCGSFSAIFPASRLHSGSVIGGKCMELNLATKPWATCAKWEART